VRDAGPGPTVKLGTIWLKNLIAHISLILWRRKAKDEF
jgi:hypothetical protein